jgi:Carbohydrate family 9 binding domain-like
MTKGVLIGVAVGATMGHVAATPPSSYPVRAAQASHAALLANGDAAWRPAETIAWGPPAYETSFRALWTTRGLYLRFDATDPHPWFTMKNRDDHLWEEEVVEIFLDPARSGRNYAELEISPGNIVCDVLMREPWPNKRSDLSWHFADLETRVVPMTGGWTGLAFIGWRSLSTLPSGGGVRLPPRAGDAWRFNVFRIERPGGPANPGSGAIEAAWSRPEAPSFHDPRAFRDLVFQPAGSGSPW